MQACMQSLIKKGVRSLGILQRGGGSNIKKNLDLRTKVRGVNSVSGENCMILK